MLQSPIPLEDMARAPSPGMTFPTRIAFSPDGRLVTCLYAQQGSLVRQLYGYDPETGQARLLLAPPGGGVTEDNLSLEEKHRRERLLFPDERHLPRKLADRVYREEQILAFFRRELGQLVRGVQVV